MVYLIDDTDNKITITNKISIPDISGTNPLSAFPYIDNNNIFNIIYGIDEHNSAITLIQCNLDTQKYIGTNNIIDISNTDLSKSNLFNPDVINYTYAFLDKSTSGTCGFFMNGYYFIITQNGEIFRSIVDNSKSTPNMYINPCYPISYYDMPIDRRFAGVM